MKEIEVPKHLRQFMLEGAQETNLGDKKGAKKQYRYGNLHIRDCLLYTSPSPRDRSVSRMPSSA